MGIRKQIRENLALIVAGLGCAFAGFGVWQSNMALELARTTAREAAFVVVNTSISEECVLSLLPLEAGSTLMAFDVVTADPSLGFPRGVRQVEGTMRFDGFARSVFSARAFSRAVPEDSLAVADVYVPILSLYLVERRGVQQRYAAIYLLNVEYVYEANVAGPSTMRCRGFIPFERLDEPVAEARLRQLWASFIRGEQLR
jgi:hypothetical protein